MADPEPRRFQLDEHEDSLESAMQRYVERGDLDGLLAVVSPDEIAVAWNRYSATPDARGDDHPDWWAIELFLGTAIFERVDLHRLLLLKLLEHATDDTLLAVAAGPLENFVSDDEDDLHWLESQCTDNPRLRTALTGTASASYVSEATMVRLDAAAGEALPRPRARSEWPQAVRDLHDAEERLAELVPGGMEAYGYLEEPTDEQRAAAEAYRAAVRAVAKR